MKKNILLILSMFTVCVQAQIAIYDTTRVYDTVSEVDSFYLFQYPKPSITPRYNGGYLGGILLQTYETPDTVTVYGVAMTFKNDFNCAVYDTVSTFKAMLMKKVGITHQSPTSTQYQLERIDSVSLNRSHPRFCWFRYTVEDNEKLDMVVPCYELYFDTPKKINRIADTFYVGRFRGGSPYLFGTNESGGFYGGASSGGLMYAAMYPYSDESLHYFRILNNSDGHYWGMFFPIVGFRCGPMKHYSLTAYGGDSAVVSWRNAELGTVYNLRLVGNDGSDTTFVTSDTAITLMNLSSTVRYQLMLRRQCHFATSNYDTTVNSEWLSYITIRGGAVDSTGNGMADTTESIMQPMGGEAFTLSPNPARGTVQVALPAAAVGGRLSLCDLAGRELVALSVTATTLTLDVGQRPAGVYLVKLVTPRGVSSRRLVVE